MPASVYPGMVNQHAPYQGVGAVAMRAVIIIVAVLISGGCGSDKDTVTGAESHGSRALLASDAHEPAPGSDAPQQDMTLREFHDGCLTSGCHAQLRQTRWVHGPVAVGACWTCHEEIGKPEEHRFEPVGEDGSACLSCHSFDSDAEYAHEPFALGACSDCHTPHGGERRSYLLNRAPSELCVTCHDLTQVRHSHPPVERGDCLACHNAHESRHENLLTISEEMLCFGCHKDHGAASVAQLDPGDSRAFLHEALVDGGCRACHFSHGTDQPAMLNDDQRSVCMNCHEDLHAGLDTATSIHGAYKGETSCTLCHTPHTSEFEGLLCAPPSDLCLGCHSAAIETPSGDLIENISKLIDSAPFVHDPAAGGECTACHSPHFAAERSLLRNHYPQQPYAEFDPTAFAMCLECHDPALVENEFTTATGFREGEQNLHYVHVHREKGRACGICHAPHAGRLPKLMRESFPFGPGDWPMPIGFTKTDTGGSCMSACHEERWYDNSYSLDLFRQQQE